MLNVKALPKSRAEAQAQGAKYYQLEQPCRNGHMAKRLASTGECMECKRGRYQRWLGNHEECTEGRNSERAERQRKQRAENPEWAAAKDARQRDRGQNPKVARIRRTPPWSTLVERQAVSEYYRNCPEGSAVDHTIPLLPVSGRIAGLHVQANLQYLLHRVNIKKGHSLDLTAEEETEAVTAGRAVWREDVSEDGRINWARYIGDKAASLYMMLAEIGRVTTAKLVKHATSGEHPRLRTALENAVGDLDSAQSVRLLSTWLYRFAGLTSGGRRLIVEKHGKVRFWRVMSSYL